VKWPVANCDKKSILFPVSFGETVVRQPLQK